MKDRHGSAMARLVERVLRGPGALPPTVRQAIAAGVGTGTPGTRGPSGSPSAAIPAAIPAPLREFAARVAGEAYRITDEDVESLRRAGFGEDEVFEAGVSAALGAGLRRLEAGLAALAEEER